jgi:cob(I)alamin adenosyltransferase
MGHRLTRIYTRTGDDGTTGLADGSRVAKDGRRVEAIGAVDELNSVLGTLLVRGLPEPIGETLLDVQHDLFDLGGALSLPGASGLGTDRIEHLERRLDELNAELPPLREFILPGGSPSAALCHLARAVCRRAERRLVALHREERIDATLTGYLNRLSDLLFVIARVLARTDGGQEVYWRHRKA